MLVFGIFDMLHLMGNILAAGFYYNLLQTNSELNSKGVDTEIAILKNLPKYDLPTKEAQKFSYVLAVASVVIFVYVLWILQGMYVNRRMRNSIERMHIVNFMSHYVKKTFLFYLIVGVTYLVLILDSDNPDYAMVVNVFVSGALGVGLGIWWVKTYEKSVAETTNVPVPA